MIIELAGASGVGKTTCLSTIAEALQNDCNVLFGKLLIDQMTKAKEKHEKLYFSTLADQHSIFNTPDFVSSYLDKVGEMNAEDSQKIQLLRFIDTHRQDYLVRKEVNEHGTEHLLVDEGLIHASFPLSQFSRNITRDVDWFISNIPLPDLVIQLHVQPKILFKRIKQRGKIVNSYRYASDEELLDRLSNVDPYLKTMEKTLLQRGCPVVHIDANGPVKEWSVKVFNAVKSATLNLKAAPLIDEFTFHQYSLLRSHAEEIDLGLDFSLPDDQNG